MHSPPPRSPSPSRTDRRSCRSSRLGNTSNFEVSGPRRKITIFDIWRSLNRQPTVPMRVSSSTTWASTSSRAGRRGPRRLRAVPRHPPRVQGPRRRGADARQHGHRLPAPGPVRRGPRRLRPVPRHQPRVQGPRRRGADARQPCSPIRSSRPVARSDRMGPAGGGSTWRPRGRGKIARRRRTLEWLERLASAEQEAGG